MKPSIKDIASDTGLSMATVSKYLNDISILPENRKKIEKSIQKLGYIPNRNARILKSTRSSTIAVILADISIPFWGSIIDYIEEILKNDGYTTAIYSSPKVEGDPTKLAFIAAQNPDGIILVPNDQNDPSADYFRSKNIPVVVIDNKLMGRGFDTVTSANYEGGYSAAEHLLSMGHKNIGIISGPTHIYTVGERVNGFFAALAENGIVLDPRYIQKGQLTYFSGQEQFRNLISLDIPPTAVFSTQLYTGIGVLLEANSQGYKIGKDISFVSFDDDEIFSGCTPPVTVVAQNVKDLGTKAASLILKRIKQGEDQTEVETCYIPTKLIVRNSVEDLRDEE